MVFVRCFRFEMFNNTIYAKTASAQTCLISRIINHRYVNKNRVQSITQLLNTQYPKHIFKFCLLGHETRPSSIAPIFQDYLKYNNKHLLRWIYHKTLRRIYTSILHQENITTKIFTIVILNILINIENVLMLKVRQTS